MLLQHRSNIGCRRKVSLSTRVAAFTSDMDEIREWLRPSGPFVEVSPFAAERIRRDYTLGFELVVTNGTTKLDLTQRCHGSSSSQRSEPPGNGEGISVPRF